MTEPMHSAEPAPVVANQPEYGRADSILFQAWLVFVLIIICFALVTYLVSYIPK